MQLRPNLRSKTLQWLFIILLSSLIIYLNDWYGSDNRSFKIGEKNKALYKFFEGIYISFRNFFRNFLKLASKLSVDGIKDLSFFDPFCLFSNGAYFFKHFLKVGDYDKSAIIWNYENKKVTLGLLKVIHWFGW